MYCMDGPLFVPKGGQVYEYVHARAIYNVLTQGRTVQNGGSNPHTPGKSHPAFATKSLLKINARPYKRVFEKGEDQYQGRIWPGGGPSAIVLVEAPRRILKSVNSTSKMLQDPIGSQLGCCSSELT